MTEVKGDKGDNGNVNGSRHRLSWTSPPPPHLSSVLILTTAAEEKTAVSINSQRQHRRRRRPPPPPDRRCHCSPLRAEAEATATIAHQQHCPPSAAAAPATAHSSPLPSSSRCSFSSLPLMDSGKTYPTSLKRRASRSAFRWATTLTSTAW